MRRTEQQKQRDKERYLTDAVYREKRKAESKATYLRLKSSPETLERLRAQARVAVKRWHATEKGKAYAKVQRRKQAERYRTDSDYRQRYNEAQKWSRLKNVYGVSREDYATRLRDQNGVCLLCLRPPRHGRRLVVDHDHVTGRVRGLLHQQCNHLLGVTGDSSDGLRAAADRLDGITRVAVA